MFATLYDRSHAIPPSPVRARQPEASSTRSYEDATHTQGIEKHETRAPGTLCPATHQRAAGASSRAAAGQGSIFSKESHSSEVWQSEARLRYKQHEDSVRSLPIRPTDSQMAATANHASDFMTTNRNAFKVPQATDYPIRCTAPMKDTALVQGAAGAKNAYETTYSAVTMASRKEALHIPSTSAGRINSHVSPYNIIHGGAPLPNNHRFETFVGQQVHRKRPDEGIDDM